VSEQDETIMKWVATLKDWARAQTTVPLYRAKSSDKDDEERQATVLAMTKRESRGVMNRAKESRI